MKAFNELTPIGKKRRLHKLAMLALEKYDINPEKISYLIEETNIFYKVVSTDGSKYALKICQEESSTIEDNLAEVFFIDEVAKNSDITIPSVVFSKDGEGVVTIETELFPEPKRIIVYNWVEGADLDGKETADLFYELGKITAKLHNATHNTVFPQGINPKKWDKVFYYRGEEPVYKQEKYQKFLDDEYHQVMDFIIPYLDKVLDEYYKDATPQLIHADLNPWNIKLHNGEIRIIDFEEAMLALPLHDFAIMLFYYRYDTNYNYEEVKKSYFDGYASINKLPEFTEQDIETLIIARTVNFLNYVLVIYDDPSKYCKVRIERVKEFINKYNLMD